MATRRGGNNPTLCVAAYWHIHAILTAVDATNVVWAWCPNVTDTDGAVVSYLKVLVEAAEVLPAWSVAVTATL